MTNSKLAAFRIERRRISVAVFEDVRLDYTGGRELASRYPKAAETVGRYVELIRQNFQIQGAAFEKDDSDVNNSRGRFTIQTIGQLRKAGVSIFEIEPQDVLASFAHPGLKFRTELPQVITSIWPILADSDTHSSCLEAAALGLYTQVERLFAGR